MIKANFSKEEALFVGRLSNAYSAAQTVLEQLRPVLESFDMVNANGNLDAAKVMAVLEAARGNK